MTPEAVLKAVESDDVRDVRAALDTIAALTGRLGLAVLGLGALTLVFSASAGVLVMAAGGVLWWSGPRMPQHEAAPMLGVAATVTALVYAFAVGMWLASTLLLMALAVPALGLRLSVRYQKLRPEPDEPFAR